MHVAVSKVTYLLTSSQPAYPAEAIDVGVMRYTFLFLKDFLGRIDCTLGEIVGSPSSVLDRPLL